MLDFVVNNPRFHCQKKLLVFLIVDGFFILRPRESLNSLKRVPEGDEDELCLAVIYAFQEKYSAIPADALAMTYAGLFQVFRVLSRIGLPRFTDPLSSDHFCLPPQAVLTLLSIFCDSV
jgi:hypothetical protein